MSSERQQRVKDIFLEALDLSPRDRPHFLTRVCAEDSSLHAEVKALITASGGADDTFLEPPAPELGDALVDASRDPEPGIAEALVFNPGQRVGNYRILELLGEGGFGDIYLAEQEEPVRRRVALKVIKLGMDTRQVVARFEVERQALALMDHPNIATVHDAGATEQGRPYFVMEFVDGLPITEYCDRQKLDVNARLVLFLKVCQAVQHAHMKGIIHRDLKPSNVLVMAGDEEPLPKVIDFGIAKATDRRLIDRTVSTRGPHFVGTPGYMSPEQASGVADIDTRTDVYSLGVLLYELLVGAPPFDMKQLREAGVDEARRTICEEEPAKPSTRLRTLTSGAETISQVRGTELPTLTRRLRGDLDWIIMRAMEKDRARRYATALDLATDVQHHLSYEPVLASPPSRVYRLKKFIRKNRAAVLGATAVFVALLVGLVTSTWLFLSAREARERAETSLVDMYTSSGLAKAQLGDPAEALLWFASGAREAHRAPERRDANFSRIDAFSRQVAAPVAAFEISADTIEKVEFDSSSRYLMVLSDGGCVIRDVVKDEALPLPVKRAAIRSAAWHPGETMLALNISTEVSLYRLPGIEMLASVTIGEGISALEFTPDGKTLAVAGKTLRLWDCVEESLKPLEIPHDDSVTALEFNARGNLLATASEDGLARVFRLSEDHTGATAILSPRDNAKLQGRARFRPRFVDNGRGLLTLRNHLFLDWWDLDRDARKREFDDEGEPIREVAVSRFGRFLAIGGKNCQVWDTVSDTAVAANPTHGNVVASLAFNPEGNLLLTGGYDRVARFWSVPGGRETVPPLEHQLNIVASAFARNRRLFATVQDDGMVRAWHLPAGPTRTYRVPFLANETYLVRSADRRLVMPAGWNMERILKSTQVFDLSSGNPVGPRLDTEGFINGGAFAPQGPLVVTLSSKATRTSVERTDAMTPERLPGIVHFWNSRSGAQVLPPIITKSEPLGAAFDDGGLLAVVCAGGEIYFVDTTTGAIRSQFNHSGQAVPGWMMRRFVLYSKPQECFIVWGLGDEVLVLDRKTGKLRYAPIELARICANVDLSPDGRHLVTASWDKTARVWDLASGQPAAAPLRHADAVFDARFSPDGTRVLTACRDHTACLWYWRTGEQASPPLHNDDEVFDVDFSADGRRILTASRSGTFSLWDAETGRPLTPPWKAGTCCYQIFETPDGDCAVLAADQLSLNVYRTGDIVDPRSSTEEVFKFAELISGQRFHEGGNVGNLSSGEWLERWRAFRTERPGLFRAESGRDFAQERVVEGRVAVPSQGSSPRAEEALHERLRMSGEHTEDLRWALETLKRDRVLRINCGGSSYEGPDGKRWGRDRFFASYGRLYGSVSMEIEDGIDMLAHSGDIAGTDSDFLYQTERWFHERNYKGQPNYRIPVFPGRYSVTLHFAEIFFEDRGRRVFDIVVENELRENDFEVLASGFATAVKREFEVEVRDGFLDLEMVPRGDNPQFAAIEVVWTDDVNE